MILAGQIYFWQGVGLLFSVLPASCASHPLVISLSLAESAGRTGSRTGCATVVFTLFSASGHFSTCRQLTARITGYWSREWASRGGVRDRKPPATVTDGAVSLSVCRSLHLTLKQLCLYLASCGRRYERKSRRPKSQTGWSPAAGKFCYNNKNIIIFLGIPVIVI